VRVRAIVVLVIAAAQVTSGGCTSKPPEDYAAKIAASRAQKDAFFNTSPDIVLPKDREKFLPLSYFPPDENYSVPAQLKPADERVRITTPTSQGKIRDMEVVGTLQFTVKGQPLQLSALVDAGTTKITRLSVMFADLTNGTETYQAGRYMELDPTATGIYMVDFNLAFHPYCYYNPEYDCPYPPAENRLTIPIRAGERLRAGDQTGPR
jgi:uncharacterized protein (DUF1684 family)